MENIFYQGGNEITQKDLESHLSSLCQLENIAILLGAGASKSAGGKVMWEIWSDFCATNKSSMPILKDRYRLITDTEIEDKTVNIELLIDNVTKFIDVEEIRGNNTRELKDILIGLYKAVTKAALLVDSDFPILNNGSNTKFDKHRNLIEKLLSNRQPGQSAPSIFTTNYDLAVEWAAEESGISIVNGFSGVHTRTFQPHTFDLGYRKINAIGEARFGHYNLYLYKLHGSLTWYQDEKGNVVECTATQAFSDIIEPLLNKDYYSHNQRLIYPGANKYSQTIGFVYGEMFRRFGEFLSKPQSALFVNGYGFGDYHINRLILGALLNPTLHIVICYPELENLERNVLSGIELSEAQKCINKIRKMNLNQVTIIGGSNAYFNNFVELIPKPVLFPQNNTAKIIADALLSIDSARGLEI
ncbi:SIR2 family protein [Aeromonas salmonicida]|uniref:SIR2 family anti-phage-associated protein n=1 Tax=Aeromonas salmonicida TaxID=645 RepID=UPI001F4157AA|nr:SIR2 family anti-phage-associated protein [Aeromonas salmonicida]MCE9934510.1 SIR2 family protein [Aeromonas salmonicida]MCE9971006.1 SIR2 family protein [Aeromonas salmonicida]